MYDEALDVSQSVDMSMSQDDKKLLTKDPKMLKNEQFDEALDVSQSLDLRTPVKKTPTPKKSRDGDKVDEESESEDESEEESDEDSDSGKDSPNKQAATLAENGSAGSAGGSEQMGDDNKFNDKPFDEAVEMGSSDDDSSVETNADSPKVHRKGKHGSSSPSIEEGKMSESGKVNVEEIERKGMEALTSMPTSQRPQLGGVGGASALGGGTNTTTNNNSMDESHDSDNDSSGSDSSSSSDGSNSQPGSPSGAHGGNGGQGSLTGSALPSGAGSGAVGTQGSNGIPEGGYNPADYASLSVPPEIRDLFAYISRYNPHEVDLDTQLKPFIPDYIPGVGEMDAFVKVGRYDADGTDKTDDLGLKVLDEPGSSQSDATVLELQLRAVSKKSSGEVFVRSIENAAKNPKEIERWITSIQALHRSKPLAQVHYKKSMPDIEDVMDVWPEDFEDALNANKGSELDQQNAANQGVVLPDPNLDMSLEEHVRVWCSLLDVPVYGGTEAKSTGPGNQGGSVAESLHVVFTTYLEFLANQHFIGENGGNGKQGGEYALEDEDYGTY